MSDNQLVIVHRLPEYYRWVDSGVGLSVESLSADDADSDDKLIGLRLISHRQECARQIMLVFSSNLKNIYVENEVSDVNGEPCLFVHSRDESTAIGHLKNIGVAVATPIFSDERDCFF